MKKIHPVILVMVVAGLASLLGYGVFSVATKLEERKAEARELRQKGGPAMTVPIWEYKVVDVKPVDWRQPGYGTYSERQADPTTFSVSDYEMNTIGAEGWELVSIVPELETTHPSGSVNMRYTKLKFFYKRRKA